MGVVVASLALGIVVIALNGQSRERYHGGLSRTGDVFLTPMRPDEADQKGSAAPEVVSAAEVATLRSILPITSVHRISGVNCGDGFCALQVQVPEDRQCPYARWVLGRNPTRDEQRAARKDVRCDGVGKEYFYFDSWYSGAGIVVAIEPDSAGTVANLTPEDAALAAAALREGKVVVDSARSVTGDRVTLGVPVSINGVEQVETKTTAPAFVLPHQPGAPIAMMTEATARSLGLTARPFITLATTSRMPTVAEQDRARAALGDRIRLTVNNPDGSDASFLLVLTIVAGIITIAAAAMATGLTAADGRGDLATLGAVGATPGVRRLLTLSQTGVIAGLGSLLGVVAGVGASVAVLFALNKRFVDVWPAPAPYPISVPWLNVAVALLVVPAVAMLGAGLLTRSRLPIERRL
jgi:putative ABC transport system permease protein